MFISMTLQWKDRRLVDSLPDDDGGARRWNVVETKIELGWNPGIVFVIFLTFSKKSDYKTLAIINNM